MNYANSNLGLGVGGVVKRMVVALTWAGFLGGYGGPWL